MKQKMQSRSCLILLAHGSRDACWREPFESLAQSLTAELTPVHVRLAYLELCPPSLADVVAEWGGDQRGFMRILPLFLSHGAHVRCDIQSQVDALKISSEQIDFELLSPAGDDPRMFALLKEIALGVSQACVNKMVDL